MPGFFDLLDDTPIVRGDEKAPPIRRATPAKKTCEDCGLYEDCMNPKIQFYGDGEKKILIVGDCPSKEEDKQGVYGTGKYLFFLKDTFKDLGFNFKKDCWYTTSLRCRPRRGNVQSFNVGICSHKLNKLIKELQPKAILLLGEHPFTSLIYPRLSGRLTGTAWTSFVGDTIPDQEYKTSLIMTNHPSYLLSTKTWEDGQESDPLIERDPSIYASFKKDIVSAYRLACSSFYESNYKSECLTTMDENEAIDWILDALEWKCVAFDYETTGRKPHREGHRIVCISISNGMYGYAFPFFNTDKFKKVWKKLMVSKVKKIAHNIQFEMLWTKVILGYWPEAVYWDTMLSAHCIHNQKPTGLKYHVYKEFGDIGYDDDADPYLKASKEEEDKHGANAINRIDQAPLDKLLVYNALDSLYTYKLFELHRNRLDDFQMEGFRFFVEGAAALAEISNNGIRVNKDAFDEADKALTLAMAEAEAEFFNTPEAKKWDGDDKLNILSVLQMSHFIFDILKAKPIKYTPTGKPTLDDEVIEKLNLPIMKPIKRYRGLNKMRSTIIRGWGRETVDGYVHTFFNLNTVDTFRSSSTNPNTQNNYKRDKEKKKIARSLVIPRRGNRLVEYDYKSLEVIINACHSQDKNMISYIMNPSSDMHFDSTKEVFLMDDVQAKKHRSAVKGLWVFSLLYGNWYGQVAKDLWEYAIEENLLEHLASKGINDYEDFEKHIKNCEDIMWNERFPQHRKWMKQQYATVLEKGYLDTYTGFRPVAPMRRNVAYNIKVQGDGFHCLLWAIIQIQKKMRGLERSFIINEIHDSIVMDVHPSEEGLIDKWVHYYMTEAIKDHWPWINLPLMVEKEAGEVDAPWNEMKPCGYLTGE